MKANEKNRTVVGSSATRNGGAVMDWNAAPAGSHNTLFIGYAEAHSRDNGQWRTHKDKHRVGCHLSSKNRWDLMQP